MDRIGDDMGSKLNGVAAATLFTLLVGVSRVALDVHWAADVLADWTFGAAWVLLWLLIARRLARKSRSWIAY